MVTTERIKKNHSIPKILRGPALRNGRLAVNASETVICRQCTSPQAVHSFYRTTRLSLVGIPQHPPRTPYAGHIEATPVTQQEDVQEVRGAMQ